MALTLTEFIPKTLQEAVMIDRSPTRYFTNLFFGEVSVHATEAIKIDLYKQNRKVAIYSARKGQGSKIKKTGYTTTPYIPPYIKEVGFLSPSDLRVRAPGIQEVLTNPTESQAMSANASFWMEQERLKLSDRIDRAEELQASQLLLTGTVTPQTEDGTTIDTVDFNRDSDLDAANNTVSTLWDLTGSNPIENINTAVRKLRRISGINDRRAVVTLSPKAAKNYRENSNTQSYLDIRRFPDDFMLKMDHIAMDQAFFMGSIGSSILVFEYDGVFDQGSTTDNQFVPDINAVIGFENAGRDVYRRHYAAIEHIDSALTAKPIEAERFFNEWVELDGSGINIQSHSAPLLVTHNPDATLTMIVTS